MENSSLTYKIVKVFIYILVGAFCLTIILPFMFVFSASISRESDILRYGLLLLPRRISFDAYTVILKGATIKNSFMASVFVAGAGTFVSMTVTSMLAYPLSKKYLPYNRIISFLIYFTVLFNGGIIPMYLLVKSLGLMNSLWSLILTAVVSPWNMILLRNFFAEIPEEVEQSAAIDGASHILILFRIILPLSLPAVAAISLFYCVGFWNQWFNALMFITEKTKWPLQTMLMQMLQASMMNSEAQIVLATSNYVQPAETLKMAVLIVTMGPIMMVYPFLQKYFAKGLLIGAVKG